MKLTEITLTDDQQEYFEQLADGCFCLFDNDAEEAFAIEEILEGSEIPSFLRPRIRWVMRDFSHHEAYRTYLKWILFQPLHKITFEQLTNSLLRWNLWQITGYAENTPLPFFLNWDEDFSQYITPAVKEIALEQTFIMKAGIAKLLRNGNSEIYDLLTALHQEYQQDPAEYQAWLNCYHSA